MDVCNQLALNNVSWFKMILAKISNIWFLGLYIIVLESLEIKALEKTAQHADFLESCS